jgi:hypothetical protein
LNYRKYRFYLFLPFLFSIFIIGCSASHTNQNNTNETSEIIEAGKIEQQNNMYATASDSVYLYWLNKSITGLKNRTKCNIFALNTIYKAGYQCPNVYLLTHDLFDKEKYNDVFPSIEIQTPNEISKGDLVIWDGHVIISESIVLLKETYYSFGIWGGSKRENDGENIINNVAYGKYKLEGNYIVRRPKKRN